jgi:bacillithiol system protein YtxJ
MALKHFENDFDIPASKIDLYFLDLLQNRAISAEIASKFNVIHQSPQALLINKGEVVYHDSHSGISVEAIKKMI